MMLLGILVMTLMLMASVNADDPIVVSTEEDLQRAVAGGGRVRYVGNGTAITLSLKLSPAVDVWIECVGPGVHWICPVAHPCLEVGGTDSKSKSSVSVFVAGCSFSGYSSQAAKPGQQRSCLNFGLATDVTLSGITVKHCMNLPSVADSGANGACLNFAGMFLNVTDSVIENCTGSLGGGMKVTK